MTEKTIGQICAEVFWRSELDAPRSPFTNSEAWEAAAAAVWNEAMEASVETIRKVAEEQAVDGEVYILAKAADAILVLKR